MTKALKKYGVVCLIGFVAMAFVSAAIGADQWAAPLELRDKKLIECGHGYLDPSISNFPQWMADHPEVMSAYPFDGVCLRIWVTGIDDYLEDFCMSGTYDVSDSAVQETIDAYKRVQWGSLTDNFLYWFLRHGGTHYARLDNDTEWNRVLNNVRLMGKVAAQCGFKGLWLDTEDYEGSPFEGYDNELVKQRGKEWIQTLQAELPDPVIMFTFIYDESPYAGRFNNFMNGILDGITGKGRIVNAYENTFYWGLSSGMRHGVGKGHVGDRARFAAYRDDVSKWRTRSDNPTKYDQYVEVGAAGWWESQQNCWPGWPWPKYAIWGNMPLALAYSDEYVWCWNEHTNFYRTLPIESHALGPNRLDPWVASTTNKTFNRGNEQVDKLSESFRDNPLTNGWYFDFDALAHAPEKPFTFAELPYTGSVPYIGAPPTGWSWDHQSLNTQAYRCGTQRHRYVHPVKDQTRAGSFFGTIDFQLSKLSTDSKNVMLMGLFNAGQADNASSLTLQVWDAKTIKVELAGSASTVTLAPELSEPLSAGSRYRFQFRYDEPSQNLYADMYKDTHRMVYPRAKLFEASTSAKAAGDFSMDEYGVAMWNVDNTTTDRSTAWQYRLYRVQLNTSAPTESAATTGLRSVYYPDSAL